MKIKKLLMDIRQSMFYLLL